MVLSLADFGPTIGGKPSGSDLYITLVLLIRSGSRSLMNIPDIPVDAAAFRQSRRHRAHDVPMSIGEEERPEELGGRRVAERQEVSGDQKA